MTNTQIFTDRYLDAQISLGAYTNKNRLKNHLEFMYGDVDLSGKRVLDIGGGTGRLTLWAAAQGAEAICLEPEIEGSSSGMRQTFEQLKSQIGEDIKATSLPMTVQDFYAKDNRCFDVIIMGNSINHIDEENCSKLHKDPKAAEAYSEFFRQTYDRLVPGGSFIVSDCDRRNFFGDLGLRSPVMPTIEWDIHQSPKIWADLIERAGMKVDRINWSTPNVLGSFGQALLDNKLAAYLLFSHFRLVASKT